MRSSDWSSGGVVPNSVTVPDELRMIRKTFEFGPSVFSHPAVLAGTSEILGQIPTSQDTEVAALDEYWARETAMYRVLGSGRSYDEYLPGRAYTYRRVAGLISDIFHVPNAHVLDVGCGSAILSRYIGEGGSPYTAIDVSHAALSFARELAADGHRQIETRFGSALDLPLAKDAGDLCVSLGLLEHFSRDEQTRILAEMKRVARSGILLIVPNTECAIFKTMCSLEEQNAGASGSFPLEEHYYDVNFSALSSAVGLNIVDEGAFHLAFPSLVPARFLSKDERDILSSVVSHAVASERPTVLERWWDAENAIVREARDQYGWFRYCAFNW